MMSVVDKVMNVDGAIILGFLILNLLIGIYFSRGITNIREYAIGKRNFSTAAIVSTIVATWIGGGSFSVAVYETYENGLYFMIPRIADGFSFFLIAYFYAPRMQEFIGKLSIAEAMGSMYGNSVRAFASICGILPTVGNIAVQFSLIGVLSTYFLGEGSGIYTVILCGIVVVTYSTFGGIKAVTFTDVIQFFTFGVVMPITAFVIWINLENNYSSVLRTLEMNPLFDFKNFMTLNNPKLLPTLWMFLFFIIPGVDPALFQRISCAKNIKQVIKSFFLTAIIIIILDSVLWYFIGIMLLSDSASATANLDANRIIPYILENYLAVEFKGFFILGIFAMCISTADSYINSGAVLLINDLTKAVGIQIPKNMELFSVRIGAFCIGICGLILSLFSTNLFDLMLQTYGFYMPIVSLPFILAIFGFRSSSLCCLIGMITAFITVCYIKIYTEVDATALGMLANLVAFMGSHYLLSQPGGWVGVQDDGTFLAIKESRTEARRLFFSKIVNINILAYLNEYAIKTKSNVYFGFFCSISLFFNLYSLPQNILNMNITLCNGLAYITLFLSTILITYPAWSTKFKNLLLISFITHLAIFNILVACNIFMFINHFGHLQMIILSVALMISSILLSWQVAVPFMIFGIALGSQVYKHYTGLTIEFENISTEVSIFYVLLMTSLICIVFIKPKEDAMALLQTKSSNLWQKVNNMDREVRSATNIKTEFINNINHEVRTPMTGITSLSQALWDNYDKVPESQRKECVYTIAKNSERLISLMNNILDFSSLTSLKMNLYLKKINITDLVHESLKRCKNLYLENKELQFKLDIENNVYAECDMHYIGHTIDNLIINAISYSRPETTVNITLKQYEGGVTSFVVRDEGIGIPKEELSSIFKPFTTSTKTHSTAGGRGIGLALCYAAIIAHKGRIWAESDGVNWAEFSFEI